MLAFPQIVSFIALLFPLGEKVTPPSIQYQLVWSDEFNNEGTPDLAKWEFETGFARNEEAQWYQKENAVDNYMKADKIQAPTIQNRIFTAPKHNVWPIPQREIDVNPALIQHAEWL
jgi:hypothetical protein